MNERYLHGFNADLAYALLSVIIVTDIHTIGHCATYLLEDRRHITHCPIQNRRRDATVELSRVGGVFFCALGYNIKLTYISSRLKV